jgi:hypothetical protein
MSILVAELAVSFAWPVVAQSIPPTCAPRAFLMARLDTGHNDVLVRRGTNAGLVIKAFKTLLEYGHSCKFFSVRPHVQWNGKNFRC